MALQGSQYKANLAISLDSEQALEVACFPRHRVQTTLCKKRLKELKDAGIMAFLSHGKSMIGNFSVLGKGHASVVVLAETVFGVKALKLRRTDSKRESLVDEAQILLSASKYRLAPRPYRWGKDYIVMDYLEGRLLGDLNVERLGTENIRILVSRILGKAFAMDLIGLDHGELSRPYKHIIVSGLEPYFIDFESASLKRKPKNLSSIISALFIRESKISLQLKKSLSLEDLNKGDILAALKSYKKKPSPNNLRLLFRLLSLY